MEKWLQLVLVAGLASALACGDRSTEAQNDVEGRIDAEVAAAKEDATSSDDAVAGAPRVSDRYQRSIDRGWQKAVAGETPAYACAGLKGRVVGTAETADAEALEALFACNVLLPVRYFETYLEKVEAGEKTCYDFQRELMTQLSAMTVSVESIEGMVAAAGGDDPQAAASGALSAAVDAATMEKGLTDPKRLVKDRLKEPARRACPDAADAILR